MSDRLALSRAEVAAWDIVIYVTGESILGVFVSVRIRFAGVVGAADTTDEVGIVGAVDVCWIVDMNGIPSDSLSPSSRNRSGATKSLKTCRLHGQMPVHCNL